MLEEKYLNHPALQVPCKHCGTVGMCPRPAACLDAAVKEIKAKELHDAIWEKAWDDLSPQRGS